MRCSAVVLAAGFVALSVTAVWQPQAEAESVVSAERLFVHFDVDSDERLDRDEWHRLIHEFVRDHTGAESPARGPAILPVEETVHPLADRIMVEIDADGEGGVSREEMQSWFERSAQRSNSSPH